MMTVAASLPADKHSFQTVLAPFLQEAGLPFARVLSAQDIQYAFAGCQGLFGQDDLFSTQIVLWAFLAQVLQDGKQAACAAAVANVATYCQQMDRPGPCGDTGDYCRARAKLQPAALRHLVQQVAEDLEQQADPSWLWHGMHASLVDGFTFTLADTSANQQAYPQPPTQAPGLGQPIARACAILSLATAAIRDLAVGPYQGKETGESALLRSLLDGLHAGDLVVFDRYFCSYMMLALLQIRGIQFCTRLHQGRRSDFQQGPRLGEADHLVTWKRPERPDWMSQDLYAQIPPTLTLRELQFVVREPNCRSEVITVICSLTDPIAYPKQEIADLFGCRWNVELDILAIKQSLGLTHVPCKSPAMIRVHLWVTLLAYNLIRHLLATAAAVHHKQPRQMSFTRGCQAVLSSWMLLSTGVCRDAAGLWAGILARIAAQEVANRPGRIEPRRIKRRSRRYHLMKEPRQMLRQKLQKHKSSP
jgi:hypothetical protein